MFIWRITYTMSSPKAMSARKMEHERDTYDKLVLAGMSEMDKLNVMHETQTHSRLLKSDNPYDPDHLAYLVKYHSTNGIQGLIDRGIVIDKIEFVGDVCYEIEKDTQ